MSHAPLQVQVTRGDQVESVHSVHAVVVDADGKLVQQWGDAEGLVFPRSAIKPMQAVAFLNSGALKKYGLTEEQLALACASHLGEKKHTDLVSQWLAKIGLSVDDLECGAHRPFHEATCDEMIRKGETPSRLHNNCSGKHCGFLSFALMAGYPTKGYSHYKHPVQVELRQILSELSHVDYEQAPWGIDGCGIPTYAVPLVSVARGMNALMSPRGEKILSAMAHHPYLISGSQSFCTDAMEVTKGKSLVKGGAEGVYTGIIPDKGIAFALKASDGAPRAAKVIAGKLLMEFGSISADEAKKLQEHLYPSVKNWEGKVVGKII